MTEMTCISTASFFDVYGQGCLRLCRDPFFFRVELGFS